MLVRTKRNYTLNWLKALACFCVVMLHCSFPGIVGKLIYGPSRFAVPLFFMISGYFVFNPDSKVVIKRLPYKIKHIGSLLIGTEITYLIWHLIQHAISGGGWNGVCGWFVDTFSFEKMFRFILFQTTPIGDVSWFMVALLFCYCATFAIARYNLWTKTSKLIPVLLITNIVIGEFFQFIGVSVQWYWCSNFWLLGFPFYSMGYWIRINQDSLCNKISRRTTVVLLVLSLITVTVERIFTSASQLFVGNIICVFVLFVFCIKYPNNNASPKGFVEWVGNSGFYVYVLHPIIRDIFNLVAGKNLEKSVILWSRPIVVFAVCLLISYGMKVCSKRLRKDRSE